MGGAQKLFCHLSEWGRGELCFCPDVRIPVPLAPTHDHEDEVSPSGGAGCFSYRSYFSSLSKSFCALRGSAAPLIPVTHPGTGVVGNSVAQFICNKPMALWGKKIWVSCLWVAKFLLPHVNYVIFGMIKKGLTKTVHSKSEGAKSHVQCMQFYSLWPPWICCSENSISYTLHHARAGEHLHHTHFWPSPYKRFEDSCCSSPQ